MYIPRGEYHFGPLIVRVDIIEPFIMSNVRIGVSPVEMHPVSFASEKELTEFIHMLDMHEDCPQNTHPFEYMRAHIKDRRVTDQVEREIEYQVGKNDLNLAPLAAVILLIAVILACL